MTKLREKMIKDLKGRRYSENTQRAYVTAVAGMAGYFMKPPDQLTQEDVHNYLFYLLEERRLSWSSCNPSGYKRLFPDSGSCQRDQGPGRP